MVTLVGLALTLGSSGAAIAADQSIGYSNITSDWIDPAASTTWTTFGLNRAMTTKLDISNYKKNKSIYVKSVTQCFSGKGLQGERAAIYSRPRLHSQDNKNVVDITPAKQIFDHGCHTWPVNRTFTNDSSGIAVVVDNYITDIGSSVLTAGAFRVK